MEPQMKLHARPWLATLVALAIGVAAFGAPKAVAADNEWKMHMVLLKDREEAKWTQKYIDEVNAAVGDDLKITLYPGGSLGIKDVDLLRILPSGTAIQAAIIYPSYLARDIPELANTITWGAIPTREKTIELLPTLKDVYGSIYARHGLELVGFVNHPLTTLEIFCKEPINSIAQLKSKKLRVNDKFAVDVWTELGVAAQIVNQYDLYLALSTGVVDCAAHPIGLAQEISLQEVAPYSAYILPYNLPPWGIVVSKAAFDKLKPETQAKLREIGDKITRESAEPFLRGEFNKMVADKAIAAGIKVIEPFSEADQKAFRDVAVKHWAELNLKTSPEAKANYEKIRAFLDR